MAARRIISEPAPRALPRPPSEYPEVVMARRTVDLAAAALERAQAELQDAEAALRFGRANAAAAALDLIETGAPPSTDDELLVGAVAAAHARLAAVEGAHRLAQERLAATLANAKVAFTAELRPVIRTALTVAAEAIEHAADLNDQLRTLSEFGERHGATIPAPWETAFGLRPRSFYDVQREERKALFAPAVPTPPPPGTVGLFFVEGAVPYGPGDQAFLPEVDAVALVRSGVAQLVDPADAARLGLVDLVEFPGPVTLRLLENYTPTFGVVLTKDSIVELDAVTAARLVNLGAAEVAE